MAWPVSKGGGDRVPITQPDCTVWIGNLPQGLTPTDLQSFMNQAGTCVRAEVKSKGTGICVFSNEEEASFAIKTLNSTDLNGSIVEVDGWTKSASSSATKRFAGGPGGAGGCGKGVFGAWPGKGEGANTPWGGTPIWQPQFQNNWPGKGGSKASNHKVRDPSLTVWLGNLPEGVPFQEVQELMNQAGNCKYAATLKRGTGFAVFDSPEEAMEAIQILNGTMLGTNSIIVDTWETKSAKS